MLVGKTLGLDKKKIYPIYCVFYELVKNILSYPQFAAYFLSNHLQTRLIFISKMIESFRQIGGFSLYLRTVKSSKVKLTYCFY